MVHKEENQETKLATIEEVLSVVELKEFAKGSQGELVKLVDVEHTRKLLLDFSKKYKKLVITPENYKKEGAEAEKTLRQTRYALQNIMKSNNDVLNNAKTENKDLIEGLINLIKPLEEKFKIEIDELAKIEKEKKEEQLRIAKEKEEALNQKLKDYDLWFEKKIVTAKSDEDVKAYDEKLIELFNSIKEYEEREFEPKKLHAIFSSRRKEILKQVELVKIQETEKIEREQNKKIILKIRIEQLERIGFENVPEQEVLKGVKEISYKSIVEFSEVSWYTEFDSLKTKIEADKIGKENEAKIAFEKAKKSWIEILDIFDSFGGASKEFRKIEVPTSKDIQLVKEKTIEIKTQKHQDKKKSIKKELDPFKNLMLEFLNSFEVKIKNSSFENEESKVILTELLSKFEKNINEILGNAINE